MCDICHIGAMQPLTATYTAWLDGNLVVLPNVDGWMCDVCGEFVHDQETVTRTELLLGSRTRSVHDGHTASDDQHLHNISPLTVHRGRAS